MLEFPFFKKAVGIALTVYKQSLPESLGSSDPQFPMSSVGGEVGKPHRLSPSLHSTK